MLQVDIDQLKKLVTTLSGVSKTIDAIDIRTSGDTLTTVLPGSGLGDIFAKAGEHTEGAWLRIAQRIDRVGTLINQAADDFKTTDEDFQKRLNSMDFKPEGTR